MIRRTEEAQRWRSVRERALVYAWVAAGTAIGGTARALVSLVAMQIVPGRFPSGTLVANVLGSFVIGLYATLTAPEGRMYVRAPTRQFVMAGLCGGFTTFSVFSLETYVFIVNRDLVLAAANIGVSVSAWLASAWMGHSIATRINRLGP